MWMVIMTAHLRINLFLDGIDVIYFWSWTYSKRNHLLGIPIGITSSAIGLKICAVAAGFKNYRSIIKIKKKKHNKMVLLAKLKLNSIEVLFFKALIDSIIIHDEFVLINNVLKEYDNTTFIKEQEVIGWLNSLEIRTPLSKIPLVGPLLF